MSLIYLIVGIVLILVVLATGRNWFLFVTAAVLSALFSWLAINGISLTIAFLLLASLARSRRLAGSQVALTPLVRAIFALTGGALVAALWSPKPGEAIFTALSWMTLGAVILFAAHLVGADGMKAVGLVGAAFTPVVLIQAFSTVLFRFNPAIESSYYRSGLAPLFVGAKGQLLDTPLGANNVLNLERAGGVLFVNCNRATMVMGVFALFYLSYGLLSHKRWPFIPAAILAAAIFFAGSKTGITLLIVLPFVAIQLSSLARGKNPASRMLTLISATVVAGIGVQLVSIFGDAYISASQETLLPRLALWGESWRAIRESPLLGLGFGGWIERWQQGQVLLAFTPRPAHNWVLQAAMDGGVVYLGLSVAFVVVTLRLIVSTLTRPTSSRVRTGRALAGMGFVWVFIHGMGDNTALYGDPANIAVLGLLAALLVSDHVDDEDRAPELGTVATSGTSPGDSKGRKRRDLNRRTSPGRKAPARTANSRGSA